MNQLSRFASGFLDLVGLQNFGEAPRALGDQVVPVVDIGDLFLVNAQRIIFGANVAAATGFNAFTADDIVVPAGELWRVHAYSISVVSAAGQSGLVAPALRTTPAAGGPRMQLADGLAYAASQTNWKVMSAHPFWAPAGYTLGFEMQQMAGGSPTAVAGQAIISRLRA